MAVTFPTTLDSFADRSSGDTISEDHMNDVQDAIELLEAKVGINTSLVTASIDYKVNKFFIAATHLFFAQATPPVGWTIDSAHKDNVLACKSDSGTYSTVGADKGSFTYTGMTNAAEAAHTHSHSHLWYDYKGTGAGDTDGSQTALTSVATKTNSSFYHLEINRGTTAWGPDEDLNTDTNAAAGTSHNHVITHDGTDRPKATVGVIATWS